MRYLVSACLTGRSCRYNGSHCVHPLYKEMLETGEAVPFCPEVLGGLSIPRDPAEIRVVDGEKKVFTEEGLDVTVAFRIGADLSAGLAEREGISCAVLKNGSPSCGFGKIYDGKFRGQHIPGQGVCADILAEKGIFLFNDESFAGSRDVTLKKMREDDLRELIQISKEAFIQDSRDNSPYGEGGPEGYDSISWHREAVSRGKFYTIRLKDKIVGGLFYSLKTDHSGWVNRIFVKPEFQGCGGSADVFSSCWNRSIRELPAGGWTLLFGLSIIRASINPWDMNLPGKFFPEKRGTTLLYLRKYENRRPDPVRFSCRC